MKNDTINVRVDGKEILNGVVLKNHGFYCVTIGNTNDMYVIYCSKMHEDVFYHLHVKNTTSIFIGRDKQNNHISYDNPFVCRTHAVVYARPSVEPSCKVATAFFAIA